MIYIIYNISNHSANTFPNTFTKTFTKPGGAEAPQRPEAGHKGVHKRECESARKDVRKLLVGMFDIHLLILKIIPKTRYIFK